MERTPKLINKTYKINVHKTHIPTVSLGSLLLGYVIWENKNYSVNINSIGKLKAIPLDNTDSINKIVLSTRGARIVIVQDDEKIWNITEPIVDRADSSMISKMVETISTLKKFEIKETDTKGKDMGLDDGAIALEIFQNDQYFGKLTFGDDTGLSGTVYANWSSLKETNSFFVGLKHEMTLIFHLINCVILNSLNQRLRISK